MDKDTIGSGTKETPMERSKRLNAEAAERFRQFNEDFGGAAFPPSVDAEGNEGPDGMSLRDWFAGQAPEIPADFPADDAPTFPERYGCEVTMSAYRLELVKWKADRLARWCWVYADAMIAARDA